MNYKDKTLSKESKLSIAVVLVNYNTTLETLKCVRSIQDADHVHDDCTIFLVDNSDQESLPDIDNIEIIRPGFNVGLSPAWCLAYSEISKRKFDYIIFLNNDVIIASNFFVKLVAGVERWGEGCAFGARIYRMDLPDVIWSRGGAVDGRKVVINHKDCDVDKSIVKNGDFETGHISGCCIVIPIKQLEKIGGPDPDFFFRGEEWDLNYRLLSANVKLVILDSMEIWHAVNASHDRFSPNMLYLAYRAKVLFARKHHANWWFIVWYIIGLSYAITLAPLKFSKLSSKKVWPIRKALVMAFIDGLRWKTIKPR